jgi:hypothetical protein
MPPATPETVKRFPILKQYVNETTAQAKTGDKYAALKYSQPIHTLNGWLAMHFAANVIDAIPKTQQVTAQTVLAQVQSMHKVDIGIGELLTWDPPPKIAKFPRLANTFAYSVSIKNGKYVLVNPKPVDVSTKASFV